MNIFLSLVEKKRPFLIRHILKYTKIRVIKLLFEIHFLGGPKLVGAFYFWTIQIRWLLEYIFWNQNQLLVVCDDLPVSSNVIWWMEIFDLKLISKLKVKSESVVTYKRHSQSVAIYIFPINRIELLMSDHSFKNM